MTWLGRMSGLKLAALIVSGVGLVFVLAGLAVFLGFTQMLDADRARAEALTPLTAADLGELPDGRDVAIEGRVSGAQPRLLRNFVAYEKQSHEKDVEGPEGEWGWTERKTPTLLVEVSGVRVSVHEGYFLTGALQEWRDPRLVNRTETRYRGITVGEPVFVLGKAAGGEIRAALVAPGDRAAYLSSVAWGRSVARWLGGGFVALGSLLLLVGAMLAILARRRRVATAA